MQKRGSMFGEGEGGRSAAEWTWRWEEGQPGLATPPT